MRRLTRKRRPTFEKIEGSSPVPCPSTLWGKQVHDIHPVTSQLQKLTGSAIDSQTRAFASCAWPLLSARSLSGPGSALSLTQLLSRSFTSLPKHFTNRGQWRRGLFCHTLKFNSCLTPVFTVTQMFKYELLLAPPQGRGQLVWFVTFLCVYVLSPCEHSSAKALLSVNSSPGAPHSTFSNTCFLFVPSLNFSAVSKGREV